MALTSSDISLQINYEPLLDQIAQLQPEHLYYMKEALIAKKLMKGHITLKLKNETMFPVPTIHFPKLCRKHEMTTTIPIPTTSIITTCPHIQQDLSYPLAVNDWHPMHSFVCNVQPVPAIIPTPSTMFTTQMCPFAGAVVQPIITSVLPQTFVQDVENISNYANEYNFTTEHIDGVTENSNKQTYYMREEDATPKNDTTLSINEKDTINFGNYDNTELQSDPLEVYLALPKELFPTARMMTLDPNPIIDEFCKMSNLLQHTPWLLDLEFGIPKSPTKRAIPTYNVKFNSINCKNAPDAIHPGFESCDPDFKKVLLFYYDCVVSAWYRGYILLNCDRSVENFQSWLLIPMQILGMCWP